MWRIGLWLHALSYVLWTLIVMAGIVFLLDAAARFVAAGFEAIT